MAPYLVGIVTMTCRILRHIQLQGRQLVGLFLKVYCAAYFLNLRQASLKA